MSSASLNVMVSAPITASTNGMRMRRCGDSSSHRLRLNSGFFINMVCFLGSVQGEIGRCGQAAGVVFLQGLADFVERNNGHLLLHQGGQQLRARLHIVRGQQYRGDGVAAGVEAYHFVPLQQLRQMALSLLGEVV